jgi:hypothetical protein
VALVDENGSATTAAATWSAYNLETTPIPNTPANFTMMQGYLDDANAGTTTVTVSGIPAAPGGYMVYVYANGLNPGATRSANYTIAAPGVGNMTTLLTDLASAYFSGTFNLVTATSPDGNYMVFSIPGTSFTLTATPTTASDGNPRAPVNGIQIVPE